MSAQINRGHRKHRHSSGVNVSAAYYGFHKINLACDEFFRSRNLPIPTFIKQKKITTNEQ